MRVKRATKLQPKIIVVSAKKIENVTKILTCYFSKQIYPLAHQTKNLHVEN